MLGSGESPNCSEFTDVEILTDQDDQLDALAKAIARQRDLSLNISSELELHEDLIDETDRALDQYVLKIRMNVWFTR